jgi:hypothetical protein
LITLDDSTYNYYAVSKPRSYSLIVFLTAAHPKFKCSICKQIDSEMSLVAQGYAKRTQDSQEEQSVFFVRLDYEQAPKTFQAMGLTSVPVIFFLPAATAADKSTIKDISQRDRFQIPANPDAESIASFLRDRTGVSVEIKRSMIWSYLLLLALFGLMAALVRPVINSLPFLLNLVRQRWIWLLVSAGIYTCAISGLIFDIIRSPQMYYANPQTGQIMFFYPQSGNQFVVEGFVIGFLNLGSALAVMVVLLASQWKEEQNRLVGIVGGLVLFVFCFRMTRSLYILKNPWYGQRF